MKAKSEKLALIQSDADPCLLVRSDMICLVYVDDCFFFVPDDSNFNSMLHKLRKSSLSLEKESDIEGFLGVYLNTNHDDGFVDSKTL